MRGNEEFPWSMDGLGIADLFSIWERDLRVAESGGRLDTTGIFWPGVATTAIESWKLAGRCGTRVLRGAPAIALPGTTAPGGGIHKRPSTPLSPNRGRICPKQRSERSGRAGLRALAKANKAD